MRKKSLLLILPCLCLLPSCQSEPIAPGGTTTFYANSLPSVAVAEEKEVKISGHTFVYYNVYKDNEDNFILKDDSSYIINRDIIFGLKFSSGVARAYTIQEKEGEPQECNLMEDNGEFRYYSIEVYGFMICVDKTLSSTHQDVNIGKIAHWC